MQVNKKVVKVIERFGFKTSILNSDTKEYEDVTIINRDELNKILIKDMEDTNNFAQCVIKLKNGNEYQTNISSTEVYTMIHAQRMLGLGYKHEMPLFIKIDTGCYGSSTTYLNIIDIESIKNSYEPKED